MQVAVTAGHGGHGKTAVVRALTGYAPRPVPGRARPGLGVASTGLAGGSWLTFVDVPGAPAALPAALAAAGTAPAALVVVAADGGWLAQTEDHCTALDAFGVREAVVAVTRADLADPKHALRQARERLARHAFAAAEIVAVSADTGAGLDELGAALDRLVRRLPVPDPAAPARLWIDGVREGGGAVTGTLTAGTVGVGDVFLLLPGGHRVRVTDVTGEAAEEGRARSPARVTVGLDGAGHVPVAPGSVLAAPGAFTLSGVIDVRTRSGEPSGRLGRRLTLHLGAAAVPVRLHPIGPDTARLTLNARLPLHAGDAAVLRDPARGTLAGVHVLDPRPPALVRRGAAAARARELATWPDRPDGTVLLRRHGVLRPAALTALGCDVPAGALALSDGWVADPGRWAELRARLTVAAAQHAVDHPRAPGVPLEEARLRLGLPTRDLVAALAEPPLRVADGRVHGPPGALPPSVLAALRRLTADLSAAPFAAPDAARLAELGLTEGALAAAEHAGAVLRLPGDVVLLPGAATEALRVLSALPQPFTLARAGDALGAPRRVVTALLEHLDGLGLARHTGAKTG
ncbi:SelB C-terminal domain-containing protein [Actinomadura flavalba]|uniref:SelB domain-containing protein n=1 Tax=Actinomadura flavalba TaxID=1120938 RepID=UPI00036A3D4C|nr:SelB C-terminal domain-containing protein [Actinomadura flavalba]